MGSTAYLPQELTTRTEQMEKNENGYPVRERHCGCCPVFNQSAGAQNAAPRTGVQENGQGLNCRGERAGERVGEGNGTLGNNGMSGNNGPHPNHSCGGDDSCLNEAALAYVYAPSQHFRMLYSAADALKHGTLFEELYKPKEVYGRE